MAGIATLSLLCLIGSSCQFQGPQRPVLCLKLDIRTNPVCSSKQPEEPEHLCVLHTHMTVQPSYTIKITIPIFAKTAVFGTLCCFVFLLLLFNYHRHQKKKNFQEFEMNAWVKSQLPSSNHCHFSDLFRQSKSLPLLQRILIVGSLWSSRAWSVC